MLLNQLLVFFLVGIDPKEGMDKIGSVFTLLVLTQLFSIVILGIYLSIGPIGTKKHFHKEDIAFALFFFALILPLLMTFILWYFSIRNNKPRF
jgi:hypothetical protein